MWIRKDKWGQLKSKLEAQKAEIESQRAMLEDQKAEIYYWEDKYYSKFNDKVITMFADSKELKEANEALKTELEKYKKLYADELQKRLELAEKVREMEGK